MDDKNDTRKLGVLIAEVFAIAVSLCALVILFAVTIRIWNWIL